MLARLARDRRGGITILAAIGMTVMIGGAAMAVDLGSVFVDSRRLQGIADAAALAAAASPASMSQEARAAVNANGWVRAVATQVTAGRWSAASMPADRFVATAAGPNAARVTASATTPLFFARIFGLAGVPLRRSATATRVDLASFSLGSRLASVDGGIANQLLGALVGGTVSLSVMDYRALADADVDLLAFADALRAQGNANGPSYNQVLAASIRLPQALGALASALDGGGAGAAAAAVRKIAGAAGGAPALSLARLIDLGPIGAQDRAAGGQSIRVDAFDLMRTMATAAGGARQVQVDLGATIPGLATTKLALAIGDRMIGSPWVTVTASGDPIVRTAQTRLYAEASIAAPAALALLGATAVRLPLYVELAEAQAQLSRITCAGGERSVGLLALPSPGHASIAEIDTGMLADQRTALAESPARLVTLGTIGVTGQTRIDLAAGGWQTVNFTSAEVAARTTKTISSGGLVTALAQSLVSQISVTANIGGITIANPAATGATKAALVTIAPLLDGVIANLTALLGIHLGQADLRIDGLRCGQAALVA